MIVCAAGIGSLQHKHPPPDKIVDHR